MPKHVAKGYRTLNMNLTLKDSRKAIAFYKKAFKAKELSLMTWPGSQSVMHATMKIGNTIVMMGDEMPQASCKSAETLGSSPVSFYLYVKDADKFIKRAVKAGAVAEMPVEDMFWGDRAGQVRDPFGYRWMVATHTNDFTDEEIRKGAEAFAVKMAGHP